MHASITVKKLDLRRKRYNCCPPMPLALHGQFLVADFAEKSRVDANA